MKKILIFLVLISAHNSLLNSQQMPEILDKPTTLTNLEDPAFSLFAKIQLKSFLKRYLTMQDDPIMHKTEDVCSWLLGTLMLYKAGRLLFGKRKLQACMLADSLLAYSQYPLYQALGRYPTFEEVKFPSITLLAMVGISKVWKKARKLFEHKFYDRYQSMLQIACKAQKSELNSADIMQLERRYHDMRSELIERGMVITLSALDEQLDTALNNIDSVLKKQEIMDFEVAFAFVSLINKMALFVNKN